MSFSVHKSVFVSGPRCFKVLNADNVKTDASHYSCNKDLQSAAQNRSSLARSTRTALFSTTVKKKLTEISQKDTFGLSNYNCSLIQGANNSLAFQEGKTPLCNVAQTRIKE